jgi:glycosyltransferase involved in cell wall biosynthesis
LQASLIIPAHNEEQRLPGTLAIYEEAMQREFGSDFEIIVVANGCADGTVGVATDAGAILPQLRVIDIEEPVGKGGAVLEGFRQANGEGVVFADADGATAPESLLKLLDALDRYDVVIGSRRLDSSVVTQRQPLARRIFGTTFAKAVRLLFGLPFEDTQCGAKAFRREAARHLARVVSETRWTFDLDVLLVTRRLGLEVYEHPVVWADRPGSRLRYASTTFEVLKALWLMKLRQSKSLVELPELPVIGAQSEREPEVVEVVEEVAVQGAT